MFEQEFETPEEALFHFGVKGMRWGVRKAPEVSADLTVPGVTLGRDGSITIKEGVSIQRLVRSSGKSLPMKDVTYASINQYDNARYIKVIGGKGILGGGRDQILSIKTTQAIKAPSVVESTKVVSDLMVHDAEFRKRNTGPLGEPIRSQDLAKITADPTGKDAQAWYHMTNVKLTFDATFDPDAPYVQKRVRETFQAKGFNAVRDENDVAGKIAKSPVIIFSPEKSLKVVGTTQITDELRKANKQELKQYKRNGKEWVDQQLYSK